MFAITFIYILYLLHEFNEHKLCLFTNIYYHSDDTSDVLLRFKKDYYGFNC